MPGRWGRTDLTRWLPVGLVLALTAAVYSGVLSNPFLLDDNHTVVHNASIRSLAGVEEWFLSPYAVSAIREYVNYRPVLMASYAVDRALWGPSPAGFHATNLAIHLGVIVLIVALGRRLARDPWTPAFAAGIFALHPINAEAVNYVTARSSSLMTLCLLGALWADERSEEDRSRVWRIAAYVLGAAALGTKEVAVVLPALVIVWRRAAHGLREPWAVTVRRAAPWVILTGCYLGVRTWVLWGLGEPAVSGPGATLGQNTLFALKVYAASLGHWVWPSGLAVDHAWPIWVTGGEAVALVGALAVALAATVVAIRRQGDLGWSAAWFWIAILPAGALGFVTRLYLYQDNRVYLAGVGLSWCVGHLTVALIRRAQAFPATRVAAAVGVVVAIGLAAKADAARTAVWADRTALWNDVLAKYPTSLVAHNGKGLVAFEAGRFDEARDWFERAVRLSPGYAEGQKNLGITYARAGEWDRAIGALQRALTIDPRYTEARVNLGKVYEHVGRPDLALDAYDQVLRDDPTRADVEARAAQLREQMGRPLALGTP